MDSVELLNYSSKLGKCCIVTLKSGAEYIGIIENVDMETYPNSVAFIDIGGKAYRPSKRLYHTKISKITILEQ